MTHNATSDLLQDASADQGDLDQELIQSCSRFQQCHTMYTGWVMSNLGDGLVDQPMPSWVKDLGSSRDQALLRIENLAPMTRTGAICKLDAARFYAAWALLGDGHATDLVTQAYSELHAFTQLSGTSPQVVGASPTYLNGAASLSD